MGYNCGYWPVNCRDRNKSYNGGTSEGFGYETFLEIYGSTHFSLLVLLQYIEYTFLGMNPSKSCKYFHPSENCQKYLNGENVNQNHVLIDIQKYANGCGIKQDAEDKIVTTCMLDDERKENFVWGVKAILMIQNV